MMVLFLYIIRHK